MKQLGVTNRYKYAAGSSVLLSQLPAHGTAAEAGTHANTIILPVMSLQVLRKAFPGTLLVPDICSLQALPKV